MPADRPPIPCWFLAALVVALGLSGCVTRRLAVHSNPPGALVYVDNQQIGTTPCATDFTYYGTRDIRLIKDGYETLSVQQPVPAPWYQIPPLDFVAETLIPGDIRDERSVSYNLAPQVVVPTSLLMERAEQLRRGVVAAAPAALPVEALPVPETGPVPSPLPQPGPASASPTGPAALPPGGQSPVYAPPPPAGRVPAE